jgi:hypothetical protein
MGTSFALSISLGHSIKLCLGRFGSGAFVCLLSVPVIAMGEIQDVGRRVGMSMTILAFGALAGPPISGAINNATGGYKAVGYYAGMEHFPFQLRSSPVYSLQAAWSCYR